MSEGAPGAVPLGRASPPTQPALPKRSPAHYLWAVLIVCIYEVFPLLCPKCGGQMRLIAFMTEGVQIRRILDHIGVDSLAGSTAPAIPGAPLIPLVNSAFWRWIGQARPCCGRGASFYVGSGLFQGAILGLMRLKCLSVFRPQTGYCDDILAEAAALLEGLTINHPFVDGNKRIAFAAADVFLRINGWRLQRAPMQIHAEMIGMLESRLTSRTWPCGFAVSPHGQSDRHWGQIANILSAKLPSCGFVVCGR